MMKNNQKWYLIFRKTEKEKNKLKAKNKELRDLLTEAVLLTDDENYESDSFTTQPWRFALDLTTEDVDEMINDN